MSNEEIVIEDNNEEIVIEDNNEEIVIEDNNEEIVIEENNEDNIIEQNNEENIIEQKLSRPNSPQNDKIELDILKLIEIFHKNNIKIKNAFCIKEDCRFLELTFENKLTFFIRISEKYSLIIEDDNISKIYIKGEISSVSTKHLTHLLNIKGELDFDIVNISESVIVYISDNSPIEVYIKTNYDEAEISENNKKKDVIDELIKGGEKIFNSKAILSVSPESSDTEDIIELEFEETDDILKDKKIIKDSTKIKLLPSNYEKENIIAGNFKICFSIIDFYKKVKEGNLGIYISRCFSLIEKNEELIRDMREDDILFKLKNISTVFEKAMKIINNDRQKLIKDKAILVANIEKWTSINNLKIDQTKVLEFINKTKTALKALNSQLLKLNNKKDDILMKYEALVDEF